MIYLLSILAGIIGLFVGSFLGVVTDRLIKKKSVIFSRSKCDKCKKDLEVFDLIPVLSFIFLKGKCRYCYTKLPYFYPVIEVTAGLLFLLTSLFVFMPSLSEINVMFSVFNLVKLFVYLTVVSLLIIVFFVDIKYGIILDRIVILLIVVSLFWLMYSNSLNIINHILTSLFTSLFFVLISSVYFLIRKKIAMGGGDIKLALFLGLFLGFPDIILNLYIAFLTAAIYSIILVVWKRNTRLTDSIPFAPFLVVGFLVTLFWAEQIYLSFSPFLKI